jgi:hypothetical protein
MQFTQPLTRRAISAWAWTVFQKGFYNVFQMLLCGMFQKEFYNVFQMLLCGECYESVYT